MEKERPGIHSNFPRPERARDDEKILTDTERKLAAFLPLASVGDIRRLLKQYGERETSGEE